MISLRKWALAALALPFLGAVAYGTYQGVVTQGQSAASPSFSAPVDGSGAVAQGNPLHVTTAVGVSLQWSGSAAANWATVTTGSGSATLLDISGSDYQYAVVYVANVGVGGVLKFSVGDEFGDQLFTYARRNDCPWSLTVPYTGNFWVVPLRGRYFGLWVNAISSGAMSGTVYFTHSDPTEKTCNQTSPQINVGQSSVGTGSAATIISARQGNVTVGRRTLVITNGGAGAVSCGPNNTVTSTTGRLLEPGQQTEAMPYDGAYYCISVTGTNLVSVQELY